ncbi:MAG TPA: hypothetical protein VGF53_04510 [Pseudolabrys sp.]
MAQTVNSTLTLLVSPATNIASIGNPGGPFSPSSFQYQLSATSGSVNYSISGLPAWLDVSAASGTVTTSATTITFTVNSNANGLAAGGYNATISFTNATNGQGNQTRSATLTVNSGGAAAPAPRTWVSGIGNDNNDCTPTAPCKTFAGAITKTAAGGEINCLDHAGYGGLTIDKSISTVCDYGEAGVLVSGTDGIVVNAAATDNVVLKGLDIDGTNSGLHGVSIIAGGVVFVIRCTIPHFTQNGLNMTSSSPGARAFILDSTISFNGGGVNVQGSGVSNVAAVVNTLIDGNTGFAVQASGAGNIVAVAKSILINSPTGISLVSGGTALSFGPANIVAGAGAFTSTNPFR